MADIEQLKQKYQPVLHALEVEGAQIIDVSLVGDQLAISATVVSEASKNRVWDAIKSADPTFADLKHDRQVVPGDQIYTCLLYTSPSPRDGLLSRMPSSA